LVYARSPTPLLDRLNVKYIFVSRAIHDIAPHLREIFAGDSYSLYENIHVYPRASMAYAVKNVPSKQATLQLITQPEFDLRETVVLPEALQKPLAQRLPARQPRVKIVDYRPETVTIEVDTEEDGILFLADTFYPGWMAYVDKKRADLLKADYCFRAVAVDKGRHSIIFAFAPLSFTTGSYISFFAGIALLVIFLHHGRKKEKAGSINGASLG
jgi:uncharacterized membrane protein YfhO